jgi:hypothetical protein
MEDTFNPVTTKHVTKVERDALTEAAYKQIVVKELLEQREKSEKLRQARMAAGWIGIKTKR